LFKSLAKDGRAFITPSMLGLCRAIADESRALDSEHRSCDEEWRVRGQYLATVAVAIQRTCL
jgi:hypothetical protein